MRLFLDANVLFAAAWQEGRARSLFTLAAKAGCSLITSPHALEEARRNLEAKRPEVLAYLEELLEGVTVVPEASPGLVQRALGQGLPLKDAPILAAAWERGAELLATGDRRHFGRLMGREVEGVRVVSLKEALAVLLDRAEGG